MVQINQRGQLQQEEGKSEDKEEKPLRREKVIADFSHSKGKDSNGEQKKQKPISREKHEKLTESVRDESDMEKKVPIVKRIQRKEEDALGKTGDGKSFAERLEELSDHQSNALMKMSTLFPFDLFPDDITIDPIKILITKRIFFSSQKMQSILVKDILDTTVEEAPFMATLKIVTSDSKDKPIRIAPLKKDDAEKAMKIIQGLVIARSESPDVGKVEAIR